MFSIATPETDFTQPYPIQAFQIVGCNLFLGFFIILMAWSQHFYGMGMEQSRKSKEAPHLEKPMLFWDSFLYMVHREKKNMSEYCQPQCLYTVIASLSQSHFAFSWLSQLTGISELLP